MGKLGKIAGTISPLLGAMTGEGLFGKLLRPKDDSEEAIAAALAEEEKKRGGVKKMARGGAVKKKPYPIRMKMNELGPKKPKAKKAAPKKSPMNKYDMSDGAVVARGNREQARDSKMPKMAKGGRVGDGCAKSGRTRGRFV